MHNFETTVTLDELLVVNFGIPRPISNQGAAGSISDRDMKISRYSLL